MMMMMLAMIRYEQAITAYKFNCWHSDDQYRTRSHPLTTPAIDGKRKFFTLSSWAPLV